MSTIVRRALLAVGALLYLWVAAVRHADAVQARKAARRAARAARA